MDGVSKQYIILSWLLLSRYTKVLSFIKQCRKLLLFMQNITKRPCKYSNTLLQTEKKIKKDIKRTRVNN